MSELAGKIVWIIGAGSGIGEASALALAGDGATVVLSGRRAEAIDGVAERVRANGGTAETAPLDIADREAVDAVAADILARHGRIDILVNSAGINTPKRAWPEITPEAWDEVVNIDLNGAFYCSHAVLPAMRAQADGLIIQISSWAGRYPTKLTGPAYNAAKHAMLAMTASLNIEEGRNGIRGCAICPGEVATPIIDKRPIPVSEEDKARMLQQEDLGATVLFVARMPAHVCVNEILISPTLNRLNL